MHCRHAFMEYPDRHRVSDAALHAECEVCSVGLYASKDGSAECLECTAGKYLAYDSTYSDQVHDEELSLLESFYRFFDWVSEEHGDDPFQGYG